MFSSKRKVHLEHINRLEVENRHLRDEIAIIKAEVKREVPRIRENLSKTKKELRDAKNRIRDLEIELEKSWETR